MENKYSEFRKNRTTSCIALLLFLGLVAGCGKKESSDETDSTHAIVPVRATQVITGTVPEQLVVTGHTEATRQEKLVAPIAGRLLSLNGLEGEVVRAGELIATIQSKEAESSEEGAQVMLAEAKTPAERAQAERMIALAKKDQNGMQVRSTISGLIATRSANSGEFVAENQELLSIIAEGDIVFVADVPLFEMPRVRIGENAAVTLPTFGETSAPLSARVFAIKPQADSSSQAGKVVFQFRNLPANLIHDLRTGIAGSATITFDIKHNAMLVPKSAVLRNDETNKETVVTFGADSLAHSVEVQSGPAIDSFVSVESGELKPGMNVIYEGNYSLADSTRITLNQSPAGTSSDSTEATGGSATGSANENTPSEKQNPNASPSNQNQSPGQIPAPTSSTPNASVPQNGRTPQPAAPTSNLPNVAPPEQNNAPAPPNGHTQNSAPASTPSGAPGSKGK
jgi:multidrug efflux pump subunit AcrA (membrane-fusion protein)